MLRVAFKASKGVWAKPATGLVGRSSVPTRSLKTASAIHNVTKGRDNKEMEGGVTINVNAYYIARNIDILNLNAQAYGSSHQEFQPKSVVVALNERYAGVDL